MKFFLDENFPPLAIAQLQQAGHTGIHTLELFPPGTADDLLFERAQLEGAVFLSTDKDFFHTVPLAFSRHNGAIVIALRAPNRIDLLRRLSDALITLGDRNLDKHGLVGNR